MKFHKLIGGNHDEFLFDEVNFRFLVHKSLINEGTRNMLWKYIKSLKTPLGVDVEIRENVYIFSPANCNEDCTGDSDSDYLWYAL